MRQEIKQVLSLFVAVAGVALAGDVSALSQRTFVASTGIDTNACSITAPCRTFGAAITKTNPGGEVIVLDSAGYGPVTIGKSISLIAPAGIYAGVTVSSGDGITVDAPGVIVVLRGLSINGQGGDNGILVLHAARLRIENCVISGMADAGIRHRADGAELIVLDTIVRDNGGSGVFILASASIVLDHVRSEHNLFDGFYMLSLANEVMATITDSLFAFNGRDGVSVDTGLPTSIPRVLVDQSVLADNTRNGFLLNGASTQSSGIVTRNAIHRNGGDGVSVLSSAFPGTVVTVSENTFNGNHTGIRSDGIGASVYAGTNKLVFSDLAFVQDNGATFFSYLNNLGVGQTVGAIQIETGR